MFRMNGMPRAQDAQERLGRCMQSSWAQDKVSGREGALGYTLSFDSSLGYQMACVIPRIAIKINTAPHRPWSP